MQGGLHPDLKIDWHEKMLRGIKGRFPQIHCTGYPASEIIAIAEYSSLSIRDTILRLRDAGSIPFPAAAPKFRRRGPLQNRAPEMPHG